MYTASNTVTHGLECREEVSSISIYISIRCDSLPRGKFLLNVVKAFCKSLKAAH